MTYITKRATMTIWFPQKNMALDLLQILTEYHTPSLARLEIFSVNDRFFVLKDTSQWKLTKEIICWSQHF